MRILLSLICVIFGNHLLRDTRKHVSPHCASRKHSCHRDVLRHVMNIKPYLSIYFAGRCTELGKPPPSCCALNCCGSVYDTTAAEPFLPAHLPGSGSATVETSLSPLSSGLLFHMFFPPASREGHFSLTRG